MKNKGKLGFFCFVLILGGVVLFAAKNEGGPASLNSGPAISQEKNLSQNSSVNLSQMKLSQNNLSQNSSVKVPEIVVSSETLEQGDTLLVKIETDAETTEINGNFGGQKIYFFRRGNFLASVVGVGTKKEPGNYELSIGLPDGAQYKKQIKVEKTAWRVRKLKVTKELEEKGLTQTKIIENLSLRDGPLVKAAVSSFSPEAYFDKPFIYPLKKIIDVGPFGDIRESPSGTVQHLGADLDADTGTPVFSINDGVVVFVKDLPTYGKTIIVDHGLGIFSLYLHLDEFKVKESQKTNRGDIIALSGNTGYSIGPHLHFSIKAQGASVDPIKFIKTLTGL